MQISKNWVFFEAVPNRFQYELVPVYACHECGIPWGTDQIGELFGGNHRLAEESVVEQVTVAIKSSPGICSICVRRILNRALNPAYAWKKEPFPDKEDLR